MVRSKFGGYGRGSVSSRDINLLAGTITGYYLRRHHWAGRESRTGQFSFTPLDNGIDACVDAGVYMGLMIAVGPSSPDWVYTSGVPKVKVSGQSSNQATYYPYYLDGDYQRYV